MTTPRGSARLIPLLTILALAVSLVPACAQKQDTATAKLYGHILLPGNAKSHAPSIVAWLTPMDESKSISPPTPGHFQLIQKNRTFIPHLLIVPVGSIVSFPNQDPFFHNVFSLFNGKRFDLGLYEAGSSREVRFSREGVSYIFCNIHPQMSAVVIALSTPLYDVVGSTGSFSIHHVPPGVYALHVWIEGAPQPDLDGLVHKLSLAEGQSLNVTIDASRVYHPINNHLNMYEKPYPSGNRRTY